MGDILKQNYENISKKVSPHVWVLTYCDKVFGEYEDYDKMIKVYQHWRSCLKPDEKELLTFDVRFKEREV